MAGAFPGLTLSRRAGLSLGEWVKERERERERERLAVIWGNYKFKGDMKEGNLLPCTASEAKRWN
jgi:hypothetical protein